MKNFNKYMELVTDTSAYTAGDLIGSVQSINSNLFDDSSGVVLARASAHFRNGVTSSVVLSLFNDAPIHTSIINNGAFSLAYNDANKLIGTVRLSDKQSIGSVSAVKELKINPDDQYLPITGVTSLSGTVYLAAIAGEAVTFAHTSAIGLNVSFSQM